MSFNLFIAVPALTTLTVIFLGWCKSIHCLQGVSLNLFIYILSIIVFQQNDVEGSEVSILTKCIFYQNTKNWLCAASFEWASHLFVPVLPPAVHRELHAGHQNNTP